MSNNHINIVIITEAGLPEGFAASNYVRLMAKGLVEAGANVRVLIPWHTENRQMPLNTLSSGTVDGFNYQYTTETPIVPESRLMKVFGIFHAMYSTGSYLFSKKRRGELDAVIYYGNHMENQFIYSMICMFLHIPFVCYLVEWFPAIPHKNPIRRIYDNLFVFLSMRTSSALVVISNHLGDCVKESSGRYKKNLPYLRSSILTDPSIWKKVRPAERSKPYILYCTDLNAYYDDACFLIESFALLDLPGISLLFIGNASEKTVHGLMDRARKNNIDTRFEMITQHIPSDELFGLYAGAEALLAPLHNDIRSIARFPSKIADYLMAARPVVSCNVGEVARYLKDNENAFLAVSDSINEYAQTIMRAMTSKDREHVAIQGQNLAIRSFDYQIHGKNLMDFIMKNSNKKCAE